MKFMIREASVWSDRYEEIEINTIEELKKLDEKNGHYGLVINFSTTNSSEMPTITIHNDYLY